MTTEGSKETNVNKEDFLRIVEASLEMLQMYRDVREDLLITQMEVHKLTLKVKALTYGMWTILVTIVISTLIKIFL